MPGFFNVLDPMMNVHFPSSWQIERLLMILSAHTYGREECERTVHYLLIKGIV